MSPQFQASDLPAPKPQQEVSHFPNSRDQASFNQFGFQALPRTSHYGLSSEHTDWPGLGQSGNQTVAPLEPQEWEPVVLDPRESLWGTAECCCHTQLHSCPLHQFPVTVSQQATHVPSGRSLSRPSPAGVLMACLIRPDLPSSVPPPPPSPWPCSLTPGPGLPQGPVEGLVQGLRATIVQSC